MKKGLFLIVLIIFISGCTEKPDIKTCEQFETRSMNIFNSRGFDLKKMLFESRIGVEYINLPGTVCNAKVEGFIYRDKFVFWNEYEGKSSYIKYEIRVFNDEKNTEDHWKYLIDQSSRAALANSYKKEKIFTMDEEKIEYVYYDELLARDIKSIRYLSDLSILSIFKELDDRNGNIKSNNIIKAIADLEDLAKKAIGI